MYRRLAVPKRIFNPSTIPSTKKMADITISTIERTIRVRLLGFSIVITWLAFTCSRIKQRTFRRLEARHMSIQAKSIMENMEISMEMSTFFCIVLPLHCAAQRNMETSTFFCIVLPKGTWKFPRFLWYCNDRPIYFKCCNCFFNLASILFMFFFFAENKEHDDLFEKIIEI